MLIGKLFSVAFVTGVGGCSPFKTKSALSLKNEKNASPKQDTRAKHV